MHSYRKSIFHETQGELALPKRTNSWVSTLSLLVCSLAGVGVLGAAGSMQLSGWIGIPILALVALINIYVGIILQRSMAQIELPIHDYTDIGLHALGTYGHTVAQVSVYATLVGVAIVFLILVGLLMHGVVEQISTGFWTLFVGAFVMLPVAILLPTYSEIKVLSYLGMIATGVVVVVTVCLSLRFYYELNYPVENQIHNFGHEGINFSSLPVALSSFTFAFSATPVFPSIILKMKNHKEWPKAITYGYFLALVMYLAVAVIGYYVYGTYLSETNTILEAIQSFDGKLKVVSQISSAIMVVHLISAFPIVINPIYLLAERSLVKTKTGGVAILIKGLIRTSITLLLILVALFLPYFINMMALISCTTGALSGYVSLIVFVFVFIGVFAFTIRKILPCIFYWALCRLSKLEKVLMVAIIFFGVASSILGFYVGMGDLIQSVKNNPNPFANVFKFD